MARALTPVGGTVVADRSSSATTLGVCLALFGPALLALVAEQVLPPPHKLGAALLSQAALIVLCVGVVLMVLRYDHQPLSSIGMRPLRWQSFALGAACAAFLIWAYGPLLARAMAFASIPWFKEALARLAAYPIWYLVLAVVIGGTAEELLYRGYAVERLATLTGSYWSAGLVSVLAFGLAHVPLWGWMAAATTVVSGAILTIFYVWQRDLLANIIAHVAADFVGIVVPMLVVRSHHFPSAP